MNFRLYLQSTLVHIIVSVLLIPVCVAQKKQTSYSLLFEMQEVPHKKGLYSIGSVTDLRTVKDTLGFTRVGNLNKSVPVVSIQPVQEIMELYINTFFNHCTNCTPFRMAIKKIELSDIDEAATQQSVALIEADFYYQDSTGTEVLFHTSSVKSKTPRRDATAWLDEELRNAIAKALDDLSDTIEKSELLAGQDGSKIGSTQKTCTMEFDLSLNRFLLCDKPKTVMMVMDMVDFEKYPELYTELGRYKRSRGLGGLLCVVGGAALGASAALFIFDKDPMPGVLIGGAVSTFIGVGIILTSVVAGRESARLYNIAFGLQNIESSSGKRAFVAGYKWQF